MALDHIAGSFKLNGFDGLDRALAELEPRLARKIERQGLREAAKVIQQEAVANAPEDTGTLKQSIKVRAIKRKKGFCGVQVTTGQGFFRGETFYGAFIEFGHHVGSRKLGDARAFVPPRPFMRPAFDSKKEQAAAAVAESVRQALAQLRSR
jgi:HK97 gp10 family phage protein